jgi:hypothetical protein
MLKYLDNSSVYALFEHICTKNPVLADVHEWLLDYGLQKDIARAISETGNSNFERLYNCYKLIEISCNNPKLSPGFRSDVILDALSLFFDGLPPYIRAARWAALRAFGTMSSIEEYVETAICALIPPVTAINEELVECIKFITYAIDKSEPAVESVFRSQLYQLVLRLVLQFNSATILHSSFRELACHSIKKKLLAEKVVAVYLPFLMAEAVNRLNGCLAATCWDVLHQFQNEGESDAEVKQVLIKYDFGGFAKGQLVGYRNLLMRTWGGPIELIPEGRQLGSL